jgi:hypothetical protein
MSSLLGPFGPGLPLRFDENSRRYFRFLRAWWMLKIAERIRRARRMRRAHKPATRRSAKHKLGDRCRERLKIRRCWLTRTDSASTEVAVGMPVARHPPHRSVLALLTHTGPVHSSPSC